MEWWNVGIVGGNRDAKFLDIPSEWQSVGSPKSSPQHIIPIFRPVRRSFSEGGYSIIPVLKEVHN